MSDSLLGFAKHTRRSTPTGKIWNRPDSSPVIHPFQTDGRTPPLPCFAGNISFSLGFLIEQAERQGLRLICRRVRLELLAFLPRLAGVIRGRGVGGGWWLVGAKLHKIACGEISACRAIWISSSTCRRQHNLVAALWITIGRLLDSRAAHVAADRMTDACRRPASQCPLIHCQVFLHYCCERT